MKTTRIYVPEYDMQTAKDASALLRTAATDAYTTISRFGDDYGGIASTIQTTLKLLARFTPELVAQGVGLDCQLYIQHRGRIEVTGYIAGEEEIGCQRLLGVGSFGRWSHSSVEQGFGDVVRSLDDFVRQIEPVLDDPKAIHLGPSCRDETCCPGSMEHYEKAVKIFDQYLRQGKGLRVEEVKPLPVWD